MKRSAITYLILLLTLGIYLLSLFLTVGNCASHIRDALVSQFEAQYEANAARYRDAQLSAQADGGDWAWYQLLWELSQTENYSYDVTAMSKITARSGEAYKVYGGSNLLLLTLPDETGETLRIVAEFERENSADVAQLFAEAEMINQIKSTFRITGYWYHQSFVLTGLVSQNSFYKTSYYDAPTELELPLTGYTAPETAGSANGGRLSRLYVQALAKAPSDDRKYSVRWKEADRFFEHVDDWKDANYPDLELVSDTLLSVQIHGRVRIPGGGEQYVYGASFSPFSLAARKLLRNGTLPFMTAAFLLAACLLLVSVDRIWRTELRSYQDVITRQEQAISHAKNAEQSRREMTSAIAHELKTPIAVLSSYAEALEENIDAEKQRHYMAVIREETGKMDRMVMELLDLSRLEAGRYHLQREDFDLEQLARDVIEPLTPQLERKHIRLLWQVDAPMVNGDPYRFSQVVENFMTNAIRYTPEGGKITLRIGTDRETFSVENQGRRIPPEHLGRVWDAFWQGNASRNEKGSGLGLAICRTIVQLHGGSCRAENTASGVRFSVSLEREKQLFQVGRRFPDELVVLDFPIAQAYTTPENVLARLNLLKGRLLMQELEEGSIRCGGAVIRNRRERLYPGSVLTWREFRIKIRLDDREKRRALMMERMRSGSIWNLDMGKNPHYLTM